MLDIGEGINEGLQNAISSVIVSKQASRLGKRWCTNN